jgi:hypothetical protein
MSWHGKAYAARGMCVCKVSYLLWPRTIARYILRRSKEGFRAAIAPEGLSAALTSARGELDVVRRQSAVYAMYARPVKNVLVRVLWGCERGWPRGQGGILRYSKC